MESIKNLFKFICSLFGSEPPAFCIYCNVSLDRCKAIGKRILRNDEIFCVFSQWLAPQTVTYNDHVCKACWNLALDVVFDMRAIKAPIPDHFTTCFYCHRSLSGIPDVHELNVENELDAQIHYAIKKIVWPRQILCSSRVCHACWVFGQLVYSYMRSNPYQITFGTHPDHHNEDLSDEDSHEYLYTNNIYDPNKVSKIKLPAYRRAKQKKNICFVEGCRQPEKYQVPQHTRKLLLTEHFFYVPEKNRVCEKHLIIDHLYIPYSIQNTSVHYFTSHQIQDMLALTNNEY